MRNNKLRTTLGLITLLAVSQAAAIASPITRVEPSNWWIGMQTSSVQLLINGERISDWQVSTDRDDIAVTEQVRLTSPNYLFVTLDIASDARSGPVTLQFSDGDNIIARHNWSLLERDGAAGSGFDQSDVIYLITPDRFANGDPDNDTVEGFGDPLNRSEPYGRHGGDLQGIIDHLDYIEQMGFTQIWLNPVLQNKQPQSSYHGYAITDHYTVDARFGSNADYLALANAARQRGIGLLMDVVLNHIGHRHWWMDDLPSADWLNYSADAPKMTNHRREALFDPYAAPGDLQRFADGWFVPTMPDLNQRQPQLAEYLIQNSIWWIETLGLSGLRVDTWPYSDKRFLTDYARRLRAEYPDLNITGEEWTHNVLITAYWQAGAHRDDGYESYLPSIIDIGLQDNLVRALKESDSWRDGLIRIYQTLANDFAYGDPSKLVTFPDNHDMSRIYTQLDEDLALYKIANGVLLTTRGIPQLYYGSEILMANPGTESHGIIRSDLPGGWAGDTSNAFTGESLSADAAEAQRFIRTLLNWRKSAHAIHHGQLTHFAPENGVYVYFRRSAEQHVMVVVNKGDAQSLALERFRRALGATQSATDVITGESLAVDRELALAAKSIAIYELSARPVLQDLAR